MVRRISQGASPAATLAAGRQRVAAVAIFLGIVFAIVSFGSRGASAADALTATDWQYLKSIGYEEHSDALDKATKGQRRYLHRLINKPRIGAQMKMNLINSYLMAIGIGTLPK